jgi:hypothetical protein
MVPRMELYDLAEDPGETRNLLGPSAAPALRETGGRLARELAEWSQSANPLETIVENSPEVIEQLRALGYVAERPENPSPEKDP